MKNNSVGILIIVESYYYTVHVLSSNAFSSISVEKMTPIIKKYRIKGAQSNYMFKFGCIGIVLLKNKYRMKALSFMIPLHGAV